MRSRSVRLSACLVAAGLILAGCGDDADDGASDPVEVDETTTMPTETETTTTMPPETTTTMPPETTTTAPTEDEEKADAPDIVDTAIAAGSFDTLVAAVQAAGLEETLRGDGPFTVFAPTDDAFAALPEGTVDALLADPSGDLTAILTYHVIEGAVLADDVAGLDGQEVTTVNGATFTVNVGDDGSVTLTDDTGNTVNVVQTDIETSNGVIHVIDAVLLPA